jgi:hypothetical protein
MDVHKDAPLTPASRELADAVGSRSSRRHFPGQGAQMGRSVPGKGVAGLCDPSARPNHQRRPTLADIVAHASRPCGASAGRPIVRRRRLAGTCWSSLNSWSFSVSPADLSSWRYLHRDHLIEEACPAHDREGLQQRLPTITPRCSALMSARYSTDDASSAINSASTRVPAAR